MSFQHVRGWLPLLLLVAGCGAEPPPVAGPPSVSPSAAQPSEEGPEPDLAGFAPEARQQIEQARGRLSQATAAGGAASRAAEAYGELGRLYLAYGLAPAARSKLAAAVSKNPGDFRWRYLLAQAAREAGELDEAIESLERAVEMRSRDIPARVWLAELLIRHGRAAEAKAQLDRALQLDGGNAAAHFLRGQAASLEEDWPKAIQSFEASLVHDPRASAVRYPLGIAYRHTGDLEAAARHLEQRGRRRPGMADPLMRGLQELATGARVFLSQGTQAMRSQNFPLAIRKFRQAATADPESASAHLNLGAALAQTGDRPGAIAALEEAIRLGLSPSSRSKASFNLGVLLERQGQVSEAAQRFREALQWDPENQTAQQRLDRLRSLGGRVPGARQAARPDGG